MEAKGTSWTRRCAVLLLLEAALALEIDPYIAARPGGVFQVPARAEILAASGLTAGLALLALLLRGRWSARFAAVAIGSGLLTLAVSCPANAAGAHLGQVLLLGAALGAWIAALARIEGSARIAIRASLVLLVALACEGAFTCVARSHAVGYTLAARQWFSRYWGEPANALGYRDIEHAQDGRPHLFVLGDSFVAGVGIADARARFSDRLQERLPRYQVHNLGWNGSDTRNEYERLAAYPFRPAVLVLAYYVNDVTGAASELGLRVPPFTPYRDLPRAARWVVTRSYALDFLYWQAPHDDLAGQGRFIADCFTRPAVVARHEEELERIVAWASKHDCRLIAVLFPDLTRVAESGTWLAPARAVFARRGVPVLEVSELVRGHTTAEITVNRNDAHPSPWLHARVAEALAARIEALDPGR